MRITIKQAAELMQASEQFIRLGLQQGIFPWGYAVKMSSRWTYWIDGEKLEASIGTAGRKRNAT